MGVDSPNPTPSAKISAVLLGFCDGFLDDLLFCTGFVQRRFRLWYYSFLSDARWASGGESHRPSRLLGLGPLDAL